jgi:molecular chaperone IbpA
VPRVGETRRAVAFWGLEAPKIDPHMRFTGVPVTGLRFDTRVCPLWKACTKDRSTEDSMRHFDFAPLYRASVGFDQLADMMDRVLASETAQPGYPPYNIEKTADDAYRISIAVAGFAADDLSVEVKEQALVVSARKAEDESPRSFLHRGIATRAFERRFHLADHVRVVGASHEDGMLHIDLAREIPEALKPRRIEIAKPQTRALPKDVVEADKVN